jgi:hypothetical protein
MYMSLSLDIVDMDRKSTKLKPSHAVTIGVQASYKNQINGNE